MRRAFRPGAERLEAHTLLSGIPWTVAAPLPPPAATAPVPVGVEMAVTTDKSVYQAGEPVHMTLTETNRGSGDVTIYDGPSTHGFVVTQNGAVVWRSNSGFQAMWVRSITLHPGESFTVSATWDGHPSLPMGGEDTGVTLTGTFQVSNQARQGGATARRPPSPSSPPRPPRSRDRPRPPHPPHPRSPRPRPGRTGRRSGPGRSAGGGRQRPGWPGSAGCRTRARPGPGAGRRSSPDLFLGPAFRAIPASRSADEKGTEARLAW